jgi:hypothetical protein
MVSITLGNGIKTLPVPPGEPRFFQIPFKEFERPVGKVQIIMKGVAGTEGPEITDKCPKTGIVGLRFLDAPAAANMLDRSTLMRLQLMCECLPR